MKSAELWFKQIWPGLQPDHDIIALMRDMQADALESAAHLVRSEIGNRSINWQHNSREWLIEFIADKIQELISQAKGQQP